MFVEKSQLAERPAMKSGDTVRVHVKVREGDKERIQVFEGVVIGLHRGGTRASFTVRKVSFGQGVERIFPLHSPTIQKVEVMRSAKVRRAKLYYLRDLKGKAARMKDVAEAKARSQNLKRQKVGSSWSVPAMRTLENALRRVGFCHVAGVDEVGRGCLAGPVVAAAVVLDPGAPHLPASAIPSWCPPPSASGCSSEITGHAIAWAVASADPREIDSINIHQASLTAMRRAVLALAPLPDIVLVDAFRVPDCRWRSAASCTAIAAAPRSRPRRSWPR